MQKKKKVFVSFKQNGKLSCFDIDGILSFEEMNYSDGDFWLRIRTIKGDYDIHNIYAQELIDQMTNIEIRGAYAKKQRD